jgi:hypothetical protein|tara:strand:+ start:303 stop:485 length:183 start_codon:yes stop_codon:yes gene_type:complete
MGKVTKLIAAVTALLVALGTLVGTVSMTIGKGPEPAAGITIVLDSPAAFKAFLDNHPSNG